MEAAVIEAVEAGNFTKDLAMLALNRNDVKENKDYLQTEAFMDAIDKHFQKKWAKYVA